MPDDQLLEMLNLEEYKSELAQAPTRATDVPQGNVPPLPQMPPTMSTAKRIDDELIKATLDAKKLEVLGRIDDMIKDANNKKSKTDKKRS